MSIGSIVSEVRAASFGRVEAELTSDLRLRGNVECGRNQPLDQNMPKWRPLSSLPLSSNVVLNTRGIAEIGQEFTDAEVKQIIEVLIGELAARSGDVDDDLTRIMMQKLSAQRQPVKRWKAEAASKCVAYAYR